MSWLILFFSITYLGPELWCPWWQPLVAPFVVVVRPMSRDRLGPPQFRILPLTFLLFTHKFCAKCLDFKYFIDCHCLFSKWQSENGAYCVYAPELIVFAAPENFWGNHTFIFLNSKTATDVALNHIYYISYLRKLANF